MTLTVGRRLEQYTLKKPQEVLIVTAEINGELDQVAIFKGYSSSLIRSTAFDPEVPVLPEGVTIKAIDRVMSPYDPQSPQYLATGLTWEQMEVLLEQAGV